MNKPLLRGIAWGLVFAAPFWVVAGIIVWVVTR